MATKTFEELKQLAIQIRDEKTNKQNTATRIGTQMLEHLNKLEQDYYDKTATDEELKQRDEKLTELSELGSNVEQIVFTNSGEINYFLPNIWTNISDVVCIRVIHTGSYLAIALYDTTTEEAQYVAQIAIRKPLSEIQDGIYSDDTSTFKVYIHDIQSLTVGRMYFGLVKNGIYNYDLQDLIRLNTLETDITQLRNDLDDIRSITDNVEQIVFTNSGEINYFLPNIWTNISDVVCIRVIHTGSYLAIALYDTTTEEAQYVAQIAIRKPLSEIQDGIYSDDTSTFKVYIHDIQSLTVGRMYFGLVKNGIYNYDLQDLIRLNTLEANDVSDIIVNLPVENSGENILVMSNSPTELSVDNSDAYVSLINASDIPNVFTVSKVNYRSAGVTNIEIWLAGRNNNEAAPTLVQNFGKYVVNSYGETVINISSNKSFVKAKFDIWYIGIKHSGKYYYSTSGTSTFRFRDGIWSPVGSISFNADFYISALSVADMTSVLSDIEEIKKAKTSLTKYDYMSIYRTTNFSDWLNWKTGTSQATDWSVSESGVTPTAHSTFEGKSRNGVLYLNKPYQSAWKKAVFDVILYTDTALDIHFARNQSTGGAPNESLYQIDCANSTLNVMALSNRDVTYTVSKSKVLDFTIVNGRKYRCEISMEDVSFKFALTDMVTAETTILTFSNTWAAGTQKDMYGFGWKAGLNAPTITYFEVFEPRNPLVCFLGDSITEGYGLTANIRNRFASVAIRSLLKNSIICAASSDTISNVLTAISNELSIIRPKYAIITIGTNDGESVTSDRYVAIKTALENIGCIPIFNHIPASSYPGHSPIIINGKIDDAGVFNGAYLDVATSIDNTPSSGVNIAMFVDGIHPNEAGTRAILCRFISDIPLLFNNDLITGYWEK